MQKGELQGYTFLPHNIDVCTLYSLLTEAVLTCRVPTMHVLNKVFKVYHFCSYKKVQVGKDQEKAQSEKDSHSKNRGGKKTN